MARLLLFGHCWVVVITSTELANSSRTSAHQIECYQHITSTFVPVFKHGMNCSLPRGVPNERLDAIRNAVFSLLGNRAASELITGFSWSFIMEMSRVSAIGIVIRLRAGRLNNRGSIPDGGKIIIFSKNFSLVCIQWIQEFAWGSKRPGRGSGQTSCNRG
jgi:hypothetical protein